MSSEQDAHSKDNPFILLKKAAHHSDMRSLSALVVHVTGLFVVMVIQWQDNWLGEMSVEGGKKKKEQADGNPAIIS